MMRSPSRRGRHARLPYLVTAGVVLAAIACVALAPASTWSGTSTESASAERRAGFISGNFEAGPPGWQQFNRLQAEPDRPASDSFMLVQKPVRQGKWAARITVRQGYSQFGHSEDVSLVLGSGEVDGDEFWYAWSTLFPKTWTKPYGWGIFAEWHPNLATSPVLSFDARKNVANFHLHSGLTDPDTNSFQYNRTFPLLKTLSNGRWNDFVMRVRWSKTRNGEIEVFHRLAGEPALRRLVSIRGMPTFQYTKDGEGMGVYTLWGLYRRSYCDIGDTVQPDCEGVEPVGTQPTSVIYQDGFTRARTFAAAVRNAFDGPRPKLPPANPRAVKRLQPNP